MHVSNIVYLKVDPSLLPYTLIPWVYALWVVFARGSYQHLYLNVNSKLMVHSSYLLKLAF